MATKHSTRKRGGFLGGLINQAIVPFSLLGMQQSYKKKRGGKKTKGRKVRNGSRRRHH